jgi:hypothetical protein
VNDLNLQSVEEALGDGIIIAVALGAHAAQQLVCKRLTNDSLAHPIVI